MGQNIWASVGFKERKEKEYIHTHIYIHTYMN